MTPLIWFVGFLLVLVGSACTSIAPMPGVSDVYFTNAQSGPGYQLYNAGSPYQILPPVGAFDREGLGRHLGEDEEQQRHPDRRDDLPRPVEVTDRERGRDRRASDREQQGQEQHDVDKLSYGDGPERPQGAGRARRRHHG